MRAIILAAGMGTRLRPLTDNTPKSLVKVCGEPMAERQIRFLKEKGIDDIIVVTGYLSDKFEYLREKYGVKLIHNDKYNLYNNVYTMYLIRDYLEDAYVTEADVYMVNNYFDENINSSAYFTGIKENFEKEWKIIFDGERVVNLKVEDGSGYIMSGISFWNKDDGVKIKKRLEEVIEMGNFKDIYWDDIVSPMLKEMSVIAKKIKTDDWFEIDSVEDLNNAEEYLRNKNI